MAGIAACVPDWHSDREPDRHFCRTSTTESAVPAVPAVQDDAGSTPRRVYRENTSSALELRPGVGADDVTPFRGSFMAAADSFVATDDSEGSPQPDEVVAVTVRP